jgi:hypothetical protein
MPRPCLIAAPNIREYATVWHGRPGTMQTDFVHQVRYPTRVAAQCDLFASRDWNGVTRATMKRRRDVLRIALTHKPQNILHASHVFRGHRTCAPGTLDENAVDKGWVVLQAFHLGADRAEFGHREID